MKLTLAKILLGLSLLPLAALAADPDCNGRWRLEVADSSALDGWTAMDLVIRTDGSKVELRYDAVWRNTRESATDTVDTAAPVEIPHYFRIDQRHMAVYARPEAPARVTAVWLDAGRTLRVEATVPLEISQGNVTMRLYDEFRFLEGGQELVLIELHSTRTRPLVYRFRRVAGE